eukprot:CAMPEP_0171300528 /NCGR_PEP_ID=MMETSP0816-20121228/9342_1 /TAXON_ID=420281 /ORGANISM="Proboscia inermis, Strain CCAP1064/1" /LENGTH=88 /DNA_ID=CAMNT_0011777071 /DNA_START=26 /DNA_END=289 /DNA_ORIENTATION=-
MCCTDTRWTTARVAVGSVDAFRVDMSLREARYKVGAPLVVSLRVMNLSNDDRNLMLLMAKDERASSSSSSEPKSKVPPQSGNAKAGKH